MKILFLTDNFPPEVNAPATRTFEHCREWVKAGHDVTVITCFPNYPQGKVYPGYTNSLCKTEYMDGIKVVRVWSYMTANKGFIKRIIDFISFSVTSFFAGLFRECDIIVATSPQFFTALSGRTLGFFKRKPWIMEVRDLWPDSIKAVGAMKESVVLKYFSKEEKWCYSSAKKIVVVTNSFKREIAKKGIPEDKIFVIKNGANTELFKPREKSQELLRKLGLEGKRVLGYVGTLGMAHKIDFLIDCVKGLDDYALMILGNGAEKENIQQKIESEGIKNVVLLDSVSKNEVAEYIALQDAALVNLRKSSLFTTVIPSKIFETASMRIPIMLGVDGEAREMVEEFGAGLFYEPENREDFLEKLNTLFSSPEVYKNCCDGGEKLAAAYDRKRLAAEMLEIISK
ncbi:MAG: glycosyltransferase family 4 protein [Bacteroidaceae bacterium]|nr:glycosyltransferase family 4 protein [Bacteroidaceae bacterium]MBQ5705101.1 glycosyltransferase family 4 protein [Bacteroidaceae bacterium]